MPVCNCGCFSEKFIAKKLRSVPVYLVKKKDMSKEGGDLQHRIFQKVHNFDY